MIGFAALVKVGVPVLAAASLVTTAVVVQHGEEKVLRPTEARAWIDEPLSGSTHSDTPITVVAHVADPGGVSSIEFSVDDKRMVTRPGSAKRIVEARFEWDPPGPGFHLLTVRGVGRDGRPGVSASAGVTIDGTPDDTATSTTTTDVGPASSTTEGATGTTITTTTVALGSTTAIPTTTRRTSTTIRSATTSPATTTTTASATTTSGSCNVGAPTPQSPADGATVISTATLTWGHGGSCVPDSYLTQVSRDAAFARIEQSASVNEPNRSWETAPLTSCVTWYWRVAAIRNRAQGPWSSTRVFNTVVRGC